MANVKRLLSNKMSDDILSMRQVGKLSGVSFSTIARAYREGGTFSKASERKFLTWMGLIEPAEPPTCATCKLFEMNDKSVGYLMDGTCRLNLPPWMKVNGRSDQQINANDSCSFYIEAAGGIG